MKKKVLMGLVIITIFASGIFVDKLLFSNKDIDDGINEPSQVNHKHMLSMMLEIDAASREYTLEERCSWPTKEDGYIFNSALSKCEKGSKLSWDDENNLVLMEGTTSDKCYVYFDVYVESSYHESCNDNTLACYIAKQYNEIQENSNIYYHDSTLENGAGDNSYRYAGSSATTNNYVCFGSVADTCPNDNLYRIIGVFDGRIRLIKADYAAGTLLGTDTDDYGGKYSYTTSYYQGESSNLKNIAGYYWNKANHDASYNATGYYNDWSYSELNKTHLNTNFLNNIGSTWANMIDKTVWKVGGNTDQTMHGYDNTASNAKIAYTNEIISPSPQVTNTYESKVSLMYLSDYFYGASPTYWTYPGYSQSGASYDYRASTGENWMYMGLIEWTMTRSSSYSEYAGNVWESGRTASAWGDMGYVNAIKLGVRPVFHLKSDIIYDSGTGTQVDPYRIKLD